MEVGFIEVDETKGEKNFGVVDEKDVVILPAFGASVQEMRLLADKKVQMVDTTCPWVSKVIYLQFCFFLSLKPEDIISMS